MDESKFNNKVLDVNYYKDVNLDIYYPDDKKDSHSIEFEITQDLMTKDIIETLGFKITNYKENMI